MIDLDASVAACDRQNAEGCIKTPEDLDRYGRIIDAVGPALIVECGTWQGMSAIWFARRAQCKVITVDLWDIPTEAVKQTWAELGIEALTQVSSVSDEAQAFVAEHVARADGPVMVILDSDHTGPHVAAEIEAYARHVTPGSYLVVEDGILRYRHDAERAYYGWTDPIHAIDEFMAAPDCEFELDTEIQNLHPVTMHPQGWLRRRG